MPALKPMDRSVAIQVVDLGKKYRIGALRGGNQTFREALASSALRPMRAVRAWTRHDPSPRKTDSIIWALRNVSFDVQRGEVVGVIGRNGAGKSTLLKVLTRITNPDEGYARIRGRVGSLLEVGTGFHNELTGRENIYLNGAILGMRREEIDRKFDEIVDFSGVEKFIDTPVKHFSSGMYLRLAFSVAAHLEPEILLVDEVLAVGDAEFQQKCLGKMSDVAGEGRTVLFVSHNMAAIQSLCSRTILLQTGRVIEDGPVAEVTGAYLASIEKVVSEQTLTSRQDRTGGTHFRFTQVEFLHADNLSPLTILLSGEPILIRLHYQCDLDRPVDGAVVSVAFRTAAGAFMFACRSDAVGKTFRIPPGEGTLDCRVPRWPLSAGRYSYTVLAENRGELLDWVKEAGYITVEMGDFYGTGVLPASAYQSVFIDFDWLQNE
jgi:lipopolysaccharide transport system ATP-binding protein